ncbi:MAG TPA: hypothetical protein PK957_03855 [Candidatus Dojkabacteria bacterium]|nr:hypothetical protein [Candidatus Dojkabacteria bacterium]HQF36748.1 hypothetical protein [Candidatus Dojkabacteria bacterium]
MIDKDINKSAKFSKKAIVLLISFFLLVAVGVIFGLYFLLTRTTKGKEALCTISVKYCEEIDVEKKINSKEDAPPIEKPLDPPIDKPINPGDSKIELPQDMPFSVAEMNRLAQKAKTRFSIYYVWDEGKPNWSEEKFIEFIEPYQNLYLASAEYSFEKYGDVFIGQSPSLEDRVNLRLTVYEKCTDMSVGFTEEVCADVKMIGSVNPFTYGVSFYINTNHPDYSNEFLIDVGMHETIHLLQYTYDEGYAGGTIPTWYKESMAVGLAYSSPSKKAIYKSDFDKYGYPETLTELNEWYNGEGDTLESLGKMRSAYYVGDLFFDFLMQKTELEEYLKIMPKKYSYFPEQNEFDKEFRNVFNGKDSEELYQDFLKTYEL